MLQRKRTLDASIAQRFLFSCYLFWLKNHQLSLPLYLDFHFWRESFLLDLYLGVFILSHRPQKINHHYRLKDHQHFNYALPSPRYPTSRLRFENRQAAFCSVPGS